jgi:predicted amino acid racemase
MRIEIDCERIQRNEKAIVEACAGQGIRVAGVAKACCGHPAVAEAMLQAAVALLAESRLSNIRCLREAGLDAEIMLLHLPFPVEAEEVVTLTETSLNSELEAAQALALAATSLGRSHKVILMLYFGERREGILLEDALDAARAISVLPGTELIRIASNVSCIGGMLPTQANTQQIVDAAERTEQALGVHTVVISGGHTTSLALLDRNELPARTN